MSSLLLNLAQSSTTPGYDPRKGSPDDLWNTFAAGYSYVIQGGDGTICDSLRGSDPATLATTNSFLSSTGSLDLSAHNFAGNVSLDWLNPDTAQVSLDSAWGTIQNIQVGAFTGRTLVLQHWVDAWVSLQNGFGQQVRIDGVTRGDITTGSGADQVWIGVDSDGAASSNQFKISTGAGNDTITIARSTRDENGLAYNPRWTSTIVVAGAGDDTVAGGGGPDTVNGGPGLDEFDVHGPQASYSITRRGIWTVLKDLRSGAANQDGTDSLAGIERVRFSDGVVALDRPPVVSPDKTLTLREDRTAALALGAPTDAEGEPLTITVQGLPDPAKGGVFLAGGTQALTAGQTLSAAQLTGLVFRPVANANGAAGAFTYTVGDGYNLSTGTVTLAITPVDDPVEARPDGYFTVTDTTISISAVDGVLRNDTAPDGGTVVANAGTRKSAASGILKIAADGSFTYTPPSGFTGYDHFAYTVKDGDGSSSVALATIKVGPQQGPQVRLDDVAAGIGGFAILGAPGQGVGLAVASAGDVDGDGRADILVGAPGPDTDPGAVFIVKGHDGGTVDLGHLRAGQATTIEGDPSGVNFGAGVQKIGDWNGDGVTDYLVADATQPSPVAYVLLGHRGGLGSTESVTTRSGVTTISVENQTDFDIRSILSEAGDVNGDGLPDLILTDRGQTYWPSYLIPGRAGTGGAITFEAASSPFFDYTRNIGDINGDGRSDLALINRTGALGGPKGGVDLILGNSDLAQVTPSSASYLDLSQAAYDVGGAGDVDGDGYDDILVGFQVASQIAGEILFGRANPDQELRSTLIGAPTNAGSSNYRVAPLGDVNGDGFADMGLVNVTSPRAYVIYGGAQTAQTLRLDDVAAGRGGFEIDAPSGSGLSDLMLAAAGDVNRDGLGDILVGDVKANAAYVIFGHP